MKWALVAATLVIAANVFVVASAARERSHPVSRVTIAVCPAQVIGGGDSEEPPALLLRIARDSAPVPAGLDSAGLRGLGFSDAVVGAIGRERDSVLRWPRARPAWVRLRQQGDSQGRFTAVAVAPRRDLLPPDSTSLVLRGRVGLLQRQVEPAADGGHQHGAPDPVAWRTVYPAVLEVIPSALHLDRGQSGALRASLGDASGCRTSAPVVVATGVRGVVWVEAVP